jgi:heme oxygenase
MTLSRQLRLATRSLHTAAERAGVMPALLRGVLPLSDYVALLWQLQAIYAALETALQQPGAPVLHPALARGPALQADIAHLGARLSPARLPTVVAAALSYADHLASLPPSWLAAHAYVRYLGDLAGGQLLARTVGRAYGLGEQGLCFYRFDAPPGDLSESLRSMLDGLPATEHDDIVAEAQSAFQRHVVLFESLAESALQG